MNELPFHFLRVSDHPPIYFVTKGHMELGYVGRCGHRWVYGQRESLTTPCEIQPTRKAAAEMLLREWKAWSG